MVTLQDASEGKQVGITLSGEVSNDDQMIEDMDNHESRVIN